MKFLVMLATLLAATAAKPSSQPHGRIVGGRDAERGQYPYQISYQFSPYLILIHRCGGAILSPTWILTAAHCITNLPDEGYFQIVAGVLRIYDVKEEYMQTSKILQKIKHPDYTRKIHDVGLLQLETPLKFNEFVKPIALPKANSEVTGRAVLTGWGSTSNTSQSNNPSTLQTIDLPILTSEECNSTLNRILKPGEINPFDPKANICTGQLINESKAACSGDSGGPLVQNNTIIGVVSWGSIPCGHNGAPSVYARVSSYLNFIKKHVTDLPK